MKYYKEADKAFVSDLDDCDVYFIHTNYFPEGAHYLIVTTSENGVSRNGDIVAEQVIESYSDPERTKLEFVTKLNVILERNNYGYIKRIPVDV